MGCRPVASRGLAATRPKEIEARIAWLEAQRGTNALERLSDEDLDRMIVEGMNALAADYGGDVGATVTALEALPDPLDRAVAAGFYGYNEIRCREREHRAWKARMAAGQG